MTDNAALYAISVHQLANRCQVDVEDSRQRVANDPQEIARGLVWRLPHTSANPCSQQDQCTPLRTGRLSPPRAVQAVRELKNPQYDDLLLYTPSAGGP
jgi:hypothetical protein